MHGVANEVAQYLTELSFLAVATVFFLTFRDGVDGGCGGNNATVASV